MWNLGVVVFLFGPSFEDIPVDYIDDDSGDR